MGMSRQGTVNDGNIPERVVENLPLKKCNFNNALSIYPCAKSNVWNTEEIKSDGKKAARKCDGTLHNITISNAELFLAWFVQQS